MSERGAVAPSPAEGRIEEQETRRAQEAIARGRLPDDLRSVCLLVLCVLAVVFTLDLGKEIILPVVLAVVLKLLLQPVVRILAARLHLPNALAALIVLLAFFAAIGGVGLSISVPASGWIERAPESLPVLKQKLAVLRRPIDAIENALKEVEAAASAPAGQGEGAPPTVTVRRGGSIALYLFAGTTTTLSRLFTTTVLLFFLLASGDRLLKGLVEVLPRFKDKRQAVEIAAEIETNISGYLLTITMMNAVVGIATGLAMELCGVGDPILWGAVAFLLNYVPILGPSAGVVMLFVVGLLSFASPWSAFAPAGLYLLIHVAEGETITPMLLARRFTLNPVLVIGSLFFWHAIWGIPGALLAVPLLATAKIVCDHVEPLTPVGHIIGS